MHVYSKVCTKTARKINRKWVESLQKLVRFVKISYITAENKKKYKNRSQIFTFDSQRSFSSFEYVGVGKEDDT